jgi:hypothetical protein
MTLYLILHRSSLVKYQPTQKINLRKSVKFVSIFLNADAPSVLNQRIGYFCLK